MFDFFSFLPLFNVACLTVSESKDVAYCCVFIWRMVVWNLLFCICFCFSYQTRLFLHYVCCYVSQGYYIFIETSSLRPTGDKAKLISQQFNGTSSSSCFTFWYHMYGQSIGSLNLYQLVGQTETLIWTQSGNKGNSWLSGQVPVGNGAGYKVCENGLRAITSWACFLLSCRWPLSEDVN